MITTVKEVIELLENLPPQTPCSTGIIEGTAWGIAIILNKQTAPCLLKERIDADARTKRFNS